MMNKRVLLAVLISLLGVHLLHAQTVLTQQSHGLLPGFTNNMINTQYDNPGPAGDAVDFDFTQLPDLGPFEGYNLDPAVVNTPVEFMLSNAVLQERNLQVFLKTDEKQLLVQGLLVGEEGHKLTRRYHEPVVKMQYPFAYGNSFEGATTCTDTYPVGYSYDYTLEYAVEADAQGTLRIPGAVYDNALRVKTTHTLVYRTHQGTEHRSTAETYRWYVPFHRFPVLVLIYHKDVEGNLQPALAAYNPVQPPVEVEKKEEPRMEPVPSVTLASVKKNLEQFNVLHNTNLYPNPFTTSLTVDYTLSEASHVVIGFYNIEGKLIRTLFAGEQATGEHSLTFTDLHALPHGQYMVNVKANGISVNRMVYHTR